MKSKLLVLFTAIVLSGIFSACTDEEITPTDKKPVARGVVLDDPGF